MPTLSAELKFELRRALMLSGFCMEKVETGRFPCAPDGYQKSAGAAKQLLEISIGNALAVELSVLIKASPPLSEILADIQMDIDIQKQLLPELAEVISNAKSGVVGYPDASPVITTARQVSVFSPSDQ